MQVQEKLSNSVEVQRFRIYASKQVSDLIVTWKLGPGLGTFGIF